MQPTDATYPSLRGRAVLVTGGASGIGAGIVEHFCAQGARVAFLDVADAAAGVLASRIEASGWPRPHFGHADVTNITELQAAIRAAATAIGPIHALVNNAAHDERHRWQDVTPAYWEDRLAVNLRHHFFAIQAVAPAMIEGGGGSIINVGSTSWRLGVGGMPAYTASKAGVEALTRSFARDLGEHGIRVNTVLPGWVMTERQLSMWMDEAGERRRRDAQCLKDRLYPPDIARLVLWLAADDSRMATNQTWCVDGGWM